MKKTFSLYEAKAQLSAIVRYVREGHPVVITVHGEPAAELRPIRPHVGDIAARLDALSDRGVLQRSNSNARIRPIARRPGALRRFLDDRDE